VDGLLLYSRVRRIDVNKAGGRVTNESCKFGASMINQVNFVHPVYFAYSAESSIPPITTLLP